MPRPLSIALIAVFCLALTARAEDKPSPAVKRILDKAVGKVRANRTEFDKANKKPLDEARAELQDLSTKLIKDGKTDEAKAVLGQVGTLEADVMKMANAPAPVAGGGAVPQKPLLERIAGKWSSSNSGTFFTIERSGVTQEVFKTGKVHQGGQLKVMPDGTAEVVYSDGCRRKFSEAVGGNKLAIETWNADGSLHSSGVVYRDE